jgi:hypothetical protein
VIRITIAMSPQPDVPVFQEYMNAIVDVLRAEGAAGLPIEVLDKRVFDRMQLTLPKRGAEYDLGGLASCAERIKGTSTDTEVTVTANPGTDFATIADTMDALEGAHKDVFPTVHLGVVRGYSDPRTRT